MSLNPTNYHNITLTRDGRVQETFGNNLPNLRTGSKILDLGCSHGKTSYELCDKYFGSQILGVDINSEVAKSWEDIEDCLEFRLIDGYKDLKNQKFDMVVAMNSLINEVKNVEGTRSERHIRECLISTMDLVEDEGFLLVSDCEVDKLVAQKKNGIFEKVYFESKPVNNRPDLNHFWNLLKRYE